jgi:signal transduction histidine kinase
LPDGKDATPLTCASKDATASSGFMSSLRRLIANLLTNAAKYTQPGGRIELTATADNAEIVLSVTDNGIGIEPDKMSAMFSQARTITGKAVWASDWRCPNR